MIHRLIDKVSGRSSWVWAQHWEDLLFLHWRVDPGALQPHVAAPLEVDVYEGSSWVSLVLFRLRVRPRWLPFLPGLSTLVEANLRTYVHLQGRPAIWFLSIHADNRLAIQLARWLTPLPYRHVAMTYERTGDLLQFHATGKDSVLADLTFLPTGMNQETMAGSLHEWLLERYRLYAPGKQAPLLQAEVAHPRWLVQRVEMSGSAAGFLRGLRLGASAIPDLAHFSSGVRAQFGRFQEVSFRSTLASLGPGG